MTRPHAAPAATITYTTSHRSRTRVKAYADTESSWPHVVLQATVGDTSRVTFDLSRPAALQLVAALLDAADALPGEATE
jgi:hypothetical protein